MRESHAQCVTLESPELVPCSMASLRSLAPNEWEGEEEATEPREGGLSCPGLQPVCVWETETTETLQGIELVF